MSSSFTDEAGIERLRGSLSGGAQPGVWKTYGIDSGAEALSNVTKGLGRLVGRWWTPLPVAADEATAPFLCIVDVDFELNAGSSVDGPLAFSLPTLVDGTGLDIFQRDNGRIAVFVVAVLGVAQHVGFATDTGQTIRSADGTAWDATHPGVWASGDKLHATVALQGIFDSD